MREIKFRLIKDGKIVGYERHVLKRQCGDERPNVICIEHSRTGTEYNRNIKGTGWWCIWFNKNYFIDHDDKKQYTGKHGIKGWIQDGIGKGQEIYEGDFLDFPTSGMGGGPCLVGPVNRYEKTKYGLEGYPRLEAGKVIGNDVENPELLEDAKGGE